MTIEVENMISQIAVATKRTAVTMDKLVETIDEMSAGLMGYMTAQNAGMTGSPYLAYMNGNEDFSRFDIEWGFPVAKPVAASGEYYMSANYGGKAIVATHKGPYARLEETYMSVMNYAKDNSLESTGVYYDYYLNNPDVTPENQLLTQVVFPVK